MAVRKLRSKIFLALLAVVLLLALAVAALPVWFPWALRPMAKRYGATYADYQRVGYQRFTLSDFALTNGPSEIHARQVTGFVPTAWLWRHLTGDRSEQFADVRSWSYTAIPGNSSPARTHAPPSVHKIFGILQPIAAILQNWAPNATLTNGTVLVQNQSIEIPQAVWTNGTLTAGVALSNLPPMTVRVSPAPSAPWKVRIDSERNQLRSEFSLTENKDRFEVSGGLDWMTNHVDVAAAFPARGFIPETASIHANAFHVRADLLRSEDITDLRGSLQADWQSNRFSVQLTAKAEQTSTNLPPVDIEIRASGDTNRAQIDVARISTPALHAELSAPVDVSFRPPFLSQPANLEVAVDLDQQHWVIAGGKLNGHATVSPGDEFPRVTFALAGTGVYSASITTSNLDVQGELNWPVLDIQRANILMADASRMELAGKYDFSQKMVRDGRVNSSGAFGGQFLPAGYSFDTATLSGAFAGPLASITNSVKAQVRGISVPQANRLDAEASWNGEGLNVKNAEITLKAGGSSLLMRGATAFSATEKSVTLTALELSNSNGVALRLEQPAQITLQNDAGTNKTWGIRLNPLHLVGGEREIRLAGNVHWPEHGSVECAAHGIEARLLSDFVPKANTEAWLNHLEFAGGWTNGPVSFRLDAEAEVQTIEKFPFSAIAKITGGPAGVTIEQFSVLSATQIVCRADGILPVSFDPTRKEDTLQIDDRAPLKLHALTDPHSVLWEKLAAATGLRLEDPNLTANLEGTWAAPQGQVSLQVQRIELSKFGRPLPPVENVDVLAVMDRAEARVTRFNFEVAKQPVRITGSIPLGEDFWAGVRHKHHLPDWREATGNLKIENAQLAPFTPLLPQILSAEGTASADISLEPGGNFRGGLSITNARTHALESIGPVRNIQLLAHLEGHTVRLDNASGEIGGQRVNIEGSMELNEEIWRTNGLPLFQVHVTGTNVPLARNPSVLLRANVDLTATNSGNGIPTVYGAVKLRDSLFLADLQALVPERAASARKRPPYFSVEVEPWAQWRLKVAVTGDSFLRVQTPLFRGKVSTVLSVEGTLKDPVALGQVKIDSGSTVTFPFSSLEVKQGFVSLTSEDPYRPRLYITAGGRRFGYDVKMEATGPVDAPVVQFSSVPGLSSEEIVLMLTAGQVPRGVGATATTQQRAQGLALFVGKNLLSDFGLGGGGQERLTFRSGEEISQNGRPTYDIEYQLTRRWSIIGEYDRFDQYNLNLKFKAYSK